MPESSPLRTKTMMYQVHILPAAETDINDAVVWWTKNYSPERAQRWHRDLIATLHTLETEALTTPLCKEADLRPGQLRQMSFGTDPEVRHRIIKVVNGKTVSIVRVIPAPGNASPQE